MCHVVRNLVCSFVLCGVLVFVSIWLETNDTNDSEEPAYPCSASNSVALLCT